MKRKGKRKGKSGRGGDRGSYDSKRKERNCWKDRKMKMKASTKPTVVHSDKECTYSLNELYVSMLAGFLPR